ncbi:hypothetical protein SAMN05216516_102430 [Izhakiella capsodis]|uniref:Uncharacterized protein n=1 Tax=Izhakiella capsodis TaxID=1367852 RepID=A0A1I4WEU5_9GAMM|nr:hypothetical protein SAMN05216516_102430 [Izhakiella capsodis]
MNGLIYRCVYLNCSHGYNDPGTLALTDHMQMPPALTHIPSMPYTPLCIAGRAASIVQL